MRKPIIVLIAVAMIAALTVPAVALARSGHGKSNVNGHKAESGSIASVVGGHKFAAKSARHAARDAAKVASRSSHDAAKGARKTAHVTDKAARKTAHEVAKAARDARRSVDAPDADEASGSVEPSGSIEASGSVEQTETAGPGLNNAFMHITANIERAFAKMAAGTKKQVPPGLIRVWFKFAGWLGIDPSTFPAATSAVPTATVEPTATIEPTVTPTP